MRTTGIYNNGIGLFYSNEGVCAMKSERNEVYFLTVKQAKINAGLHESDEDWDLWNDARARAEGKRNQFFLEEWPEIERTLQNVRSVS